MIRVTRAMAALGVLIACFLLSVTCFAEKSSLALSSSSPSPSPAKATSGVVARTAPSRVPGAPSAKRAKGPELALGLASWEPFTRQYPVQTLAKRVGAKTYKDIYGDWDFKSPEVLEGKLRKVFDEAPRIHFNLLAVSMDSFKRFLRNPRLVGMNVTNWELHTILSTPKLLRKTTFYGWNGEVVPPPDLAELHARQDGS